MKFDENPYYDKLRFLLTRELVDYNQEPCADIFGRKFDEKDNLLDPISVNVDHSMAVEECP